MSLFFFSLTGLRTLTRKDHVVLGYKTSFKKFKMIEIIFPDQNVTALEFKTKCNWKISKDLSFKILF